MTPLSTGSMARLCADAAGKRPGTDAAGTRARAELATSEERV
jgi:hypothetical protein